MRRFQFSNIPNPNEFFEAPKDQINHLFRVLRLKEGDLIEASNGQGEIFILQIILSNEDQIQFLVQDKKQGSEIPLFTTAFIGELKSDAMDQSISHLAEHGIQTIIPFFSERSIVKFSANDLYKKQERRQKIINESIKKVGGLYTGNILPSITFKELQHYLPKYSTNILFWEEEHSQSSHLNTVDFSKDHSFLIGPEGGFSYKEVNQLCIWGCQKFSLGTRILRAPQAASSAASIIRFLWEQQKNTL